MFDPIAYINEPRWQTVSLGLERTRELLHALGDPQDRLRFVHVAGTNGKGSTCALCASILEQAGYRVGLFTSPALYRFEDRLRVNGSIISLEELRDITLRVKDAADAMDEHPTEFELLTAVAFCYFERSACDIVVMEVGLGGRLDSTNVIETAEASVITPISFDHCALLGSTLVEIAGEKAGIIKRGVPVVSAPQEPEVRTVIEDAAANAQSTLVEVALAQLEGTNERFSYRERTDLSLGLAGPFQLVNAATALDTIDLLKSRGWSVSEEAICEGLRAASWPGRFEVVCEEPLILFDGGHNVSGMDALAQALSVRYPSHARIVLTGVLADKDHEVMAKRLVSFADEIIAITPSNPRALSALDYARELQELEGDDVRARSIVAAPDIASGVRCALERYHASRVAHDSPLICVCGSLYLLGSVMEVLRQGGLVL